MCICSLCQLHLFPRSLNLALSDVKSFSEILTPPTERQGVRTFVKSYDDKVIKEAILREMRRGGQDILCL